MIGFKHMTQRLIALLQTPVSLFTFVLLCLLHPVHAQKELKIYENAEKAFYDEEFEDALMLYNQVVDINPKYKDAPYKAEICALLQRKNRERSLEKILSYMDTKGQYDKFYYYWMGRIYVNKYMFPEAVNAWSRFLGQKSYKSKEIVAETKNFVKEAKVLTAYFDNTDNFELHQIEAPVNTVGSEITPVYFEKTKELIFASDGGKPGEKLKIYHTSHKDYRWTKPRALNVLGEFNPENANIEVVNQDGKLFLFNEKSGTLSYSEPSGDEWTAPREFDSKITAKNLASHFFINPHEDRIIFASKNKKNGLDIMESFKDAESGKWSKPTLLPGTINTVDNEDSPYLSPDENTLYFSSNRPGGVGGMDIYMSRLNPDTKTWETPENMGWPINSPDDDLHFKMNDDQESGYLSSNRINSKGSFDIFFFWKIEKARVKGRVLNALTEEVITGGEIRFHPSQYLIEYFRSPIDEDGKYVTEIISDEIFRVEVISGIDTLGVEAYEIHDAKGERITHIQDFYAVSKNASPEEIAAFNAKIKTIKKPKPRITASKKETAVNKLEIEEKKQKVQVKQKALVEQFEQPIASANPIDNVISQKNTNSTSPKWKPQKKVLRNIYFEFGTSQLSPESNAALTKLLKTLQETPQLKIEIGGHTDSIGDDAVNAWLSQNRAEAVKAWLVKRGIDTERIIAKGYGESKPLASNDDEYSGRELNRRIEIIPLD